MLYYRTQNLKKDSWAIDYPFFYGTLLHKVVDYIKSITEEQNKKAEQLMWLQLFRSGSKNQIEPFYRTSIIY